MLAIEVQTRFMRNIDFDRVIELDHTSSGDYAWEPDDLWSEWKADQGAGIVAVDYNDYPLGFCVYNMDDKERYEIRHLVVEKNLQRTGIATALINRMKDKLNDRRYILSFTVPDDNLPIQLFLKKMDFRAKVVRSANFYIFEYEKV